MTALNLLERERVMEGGERQRRRERGGERGEASIKHVRRQSSPRYKKMIKRDLMSYAKRGKRTPVSWRIMLLHLPLSHSLSPTLSVYPTIIVSISQIRVS